MRLFVALEPPGEVATALARWGAGIAGEDPALAPVGAEALHVTMAFLGECPADVVADLAAVVRAAATPAPPAPALGVAGALWLAPRRPHVLTVALEDVDAGLEAMHHRLWQGLAPLGFRLEDRPFRPHITVARVRRGQRPRNLDVPGPPVTSFPAVALTLLRSRLGGGAARYEPLERVPLCGTDAERPR